MSARRNISPHILVVVVVVNVKCSGSRRIHSRHCLAVLLAACPFVAASFSFFLAVPFELYAAAVALSHTKLEHPLNCRGHRLEMRLPPFSCRQLKNVGFSNEQRLTTGLTLTSAWQLSNPSGFNLGALTLACASLAQG